LPDHYEELRGFDSLRRLAEEVAGEVYRCERLGYGRTTVRDVIDEMTDDALAERAGAGATQ